MIEYRRQEPLIFIHVPKTAGSSVQKVFKGWFGEGLLRHYMNQATGQAPLAIDIKQRVKPDQPQCLFGHFNRLRGFGIPDRYDYVRQFITILRNPLEQTISRYFYLRASSEQHKDQSRIPKEDLETFVRTTSSTLLIHFPTILTPENFKDVIEEKFIAVGITEQIESSLALIAQKLGFPLPDIPHVNATPRDDTVSDSCRNEFRDKHALEYMVYEYCQKRLTQQIQKN